MRIINNIYINFCAFACKNKFILYKQAILCLFLLQALYAENLFVFGTFYLYEKHTVGNDSTISEWIINYSGGFTKRGIIGHLCIYFAEALSLNLRESILIFQISILCTYFVVLYYFFKDLEVNKLILLSIFTPIFILYPIAEIEVLARKEIIVFTLFLIYILFPLRHWFKNILLILFSFFSVLIWEPILFFFPLIFLYLIINSAYVVGILPTTGLPIPFISYGGSQTIFSLISIGLLISISKSSYSNINPKYYYDRS